MDALNLYARERKALLRSRAAPDDLVVCRVHALFYGRPAERHDTRADAPPHAPYERIVAVEYRHVVGFLRGEDALLRRAVVGEARVAVEVVFGQVQQDRDPRAEILHPFELEAAHLDDAPVPILAGEADERCADVAADERVRAGGFEHRADQRRRRAFAVRAGDRDERRTYKSIAELDLAHYLHAAPHGGLQQRIFLRHAGAGNQDVDIFQPGGIFAPEAKIDRRVAQRSDFPREIGLAPPVADSDVGAALGEKTSRGDAGARKPQHHHLFALDVHDSTDTNPHYRSFRVLSATTAQTIEMIQKRTMICGSGQPLSS